MYVCMYIKQNYLFCNVVVHWNRHLPLAPMAPPLSIEYFDLCSDWLFWTANPSQLNIPRRVEEAAPASADARQRTHARTERNVDKPQPSEDKQLVTDIQLNTHN